MRRWFVLNTPEVQARLSQSVIPWEAIRRWD